ncbi:MAG: gamma-glutamyltransferase family protein, partial [Gaiellaceae bacterium]
MLFTTRPELRGTFGMVASTHWLASQTGMAVLECGGNAFDAAVATGFVLQVVEPHLNGPGGEVPAVFWSVDRGEPLALCGQGVAPAAATIARFHELGHELIPGTGVLAACVPGAFGGWLLLLRELGTWRLADVLELAIGYAERGYPLHERIRATIELNEELLRGWPGSRDLYLPVPEAGTLFRNPALAATYRRIVDESRGGSREEEIERARLAFYEGFVAEELDRFSAKEQGLLTGADLAAWSATIEPVVTFDYRGLTVCKTRPWAAGPVGLQQLALLQSFELTELSRAEFVHVLTECAKLAFADRDALYGDAEVPLDTLLSKEYSDARRALVGEEASADYTPGLGRLPRVREAAATPGSGEPGRGTVHLDVVDRFGNLFSATPSGGWLQSSPVIPELGWPLGTRAQMFWLEEGLPSSLRPGARPRTTLCPGLALRQGEPYLAWGTPGGDQQEQWAVHVLLRHIDLGMNLQEAIDAPEFHTDHLISSFFPRGFARRSLALESRFDARTVA